MTAAIALIFGAICFILSAATPSSGAEKLRVAYPTLGPGSTPSWVTHEMGFWKKNGLDIELILLSVDNGSNLLLTDPDDSEERRSARVLSYLV